MPRFNDIAGKTFGLLTAIRVAFTHPRQGRQWECICSCGNRVVVSLGNLTSGNSTSCGCKARKAVTDRSTTHGETRSRKRSPEYQIWASMIQRCTNPKAKRYADYGGRGITVCDRWRKFESFLADMGRRPFPDYELDRINNDEGYCKGNCRWTSSVQQNRNKRTNKVISTPVGEMLLCEAASVSGLSHETLRKRIARGWPINRLFDPSGTRL